INGFFFNDGPYWQRHDSQHFKNFSARRISNIPMPAGPFSIAVKRKTDDK
ncbi:hypothetical protein FRX31_002903, partial [Thalictrum thalictroides]